MTTLTLDPTQRLNIIAGLDRVEAAGREAWEIRYLQRTLDLTDDERVVIGWRVLQDDKGRQSAMWSNTGESRVYELRDEDVKRIARAMEKYPVVLARDRPWWEPLAEELHSHWKEIPTLSNGLTQGATSGGSTVAA